MAVVAREMDDRLRTINDEPTTEWVSVSRIFVDPVYQRRVSEALVKKIADSFDSRAMHVVFLSRRPNGALAVIDGNHRVLALKRRFPDHFNLKVEAKIVDGLTNEEEAWLFRKLNGTRKAPTVRDDFRAALAANDPVAHEIKRIVEESGLTLQIEGKTTTLTQVSALASVIQIYKQGGDLRLLLGIAHHVWPDDPRAHSGFLLMGLHAFVRRYGHVYTHADLLERLSTISINAIVQKASSYRAGATSVTRDDAVGRALVEVYNARRRTGALPAWDDPEIMKRVRSMGTKLGKAWSLQEKNGDTQP